MSLRRLVEKVNFIDDLDSALIPESVDQEVLTTSLLSYFLHIFIISHPFISPITFFISFIIFTHFIFFFRISNIIEREDAFSQIQNTSQNPNDNQSKHYCFSIFTITLFIYLFICLLDNRMSRVTEILERSYNFYFNVNDLNPFITYFIIY